MDYKATFIQLDNSLILHSEQYESIATLIYDTDPYIYPAMFGFGIQGRRIAKTVLSELIRLGTDSMFCQDNLFVATVGDRIIGLILWCRGSLVWNADVLANVAINKGIELNKHNLQKVNELYFCENYNNCPDKSGISLINVCIDERFRGQGNGDAMIKAFLNTHAGEKFGLCVIADNENAIKLYQNNGFEIKSEFEGFSLDDNKPLCYEMAR